MDFSLRPLTPVPYRTNGTDTADLLVQHREAYIDWEKII
jgi:hypothetical protein